MKQFLHKTQSTIDIVMCSMFNLRIDNRRQSELSSFSSLDITSTLTCYIYEKRDYLSTSDHTYFTMISLDFQKIKL